MAFWLRKCIFKAAVFITEWRIKTTLSIVGTETENISAVATES